MKIPSKVLIGTQVYKVEERTEGVDGMLKESYAYTLIENNLIVMRKDLPLERKRSLFVHELLHAVIFTFSRTDRVEKNESYDDWEHHFITTVQEPLVMVFRDNPDLVEYLTAE